MAIRLVILLLESSLVKLFEAEGTYKMFWVELFEHGSNTPACDGLLAPRKKHKKSIMLQNIAHYTAARGHNKWKTHPTYRQAEHDMHISQKQTTKTISKIVLAI